MYERNVLIQLLLTPHNIDSYSFFNLTLSAAASDDGNIFLLIQKLLSHLAGYFPIVNDRDNGPIANNLKQSHAYIVIVENKLLSSVKCA